MKTSMQPRDDDLVQRRIDAALDIDPHTLAAEHLSEAVDFIKGAMTVVEEQIMSIANQIDSAQASVHIDGKYADPDWWRRVQQAQRHKGHDKQVLQNKLGAINKRIRQINFQEETMREERLFIAMAKKHLQEETYRMLWEYVKEEKKYG